KERAADILEEMSPGAAADALEDLDEEVAEQIIASMAPEEAAEVQELLGYAEGSAGRIMRTDFVRVRATATVGDALALLRALPEVPDPLLAVYVVAQDTAPVEPRASKSNDDRAVALRGIVRLRSLVIADRSTPLAEVMDHDTPTVRPADRAEEAARIMAEYNLLAVPVLNDAERMIGIVTVDDALAELLPEIWQSRGARAFV
ncbi:magnesium transporter, partial [Accumulibacter sp.]